MKSLRDLVEKMPTSREGLEEKVRKYSPQIDQAIEANPAYGRTLGRIAGETFDKYHKYLGGVTEKFSAAGHAIGYTADAWLATGDIVGSLGGKFVNFLAQIPQKVYSIAYGVRTHNYLDSMQNILEGFVSYLPGFTILDQGLSRIVQKRMVTEASSKMEDALGLKHEPWHQKVYERMKEAYNEVKNRARNVISPREPEPALAAT